VGATFAETVHRVPAGGCNTQRIGRNVRATVGDIVDFGRGIVDLPSVDSVDSTEFLGLVQFLVHQVDADDVPTECVGDVDRREADPATAVDDDVVASANRSSVGHCVE